MCCLLFCLGVPPWAGGFGAVNGRAGHAGRAAGVRKHAKNASPACCCPSATGCCGMRSLHLGCTEVVRLKDRLYVPMPPLLLNRHQPSPPPAPGRRTRWRRRRRQPALRDQPEPAVGTRQPRRIRRCHGSGRRRGHLCGCFHDERPLPPGAPCCACCGRPQSGWWVQGTAGVPPPLSGTHAWLVQHTCLRRCTCTPSNNSIPLLHHPPAGERQGVPGLQPHVRPGHRVGRGCEHWAAAAVYCCPSCCAVLPCLPAGNECLALAANSAQTETCTRTLMGHNLIGSPRFSRRRWMPLAPWPTRCIRARTAGPWAPPAPATTSWPPPGAHVGLHGYQMCRFACMRCLHVLPARQQAASPRPLSPASPSSLAANLLPAFIPSSLASLPSPAAVPWEMASTANQQQAAAQRHAAAGR